jgi:hypothetical protein
MELFPKTIFLNHTNPSLFSIIFFSHGTWEIPKVFQNFVDTDECECTSHSFPFLSFFFFPSLLLHLPLPSAVRDGQTEFFGLCGKGKRNESGRGKRRKGGEGKGEKEGENCDCYLGNLSFLNSIL